MVIPREAHAAIFVFVVSLFSLGACSRWPTPVGPLASLAMEYTRTGGVNNCRESAALADYRELRACLGEAGDTTGYFYTRRSGEVVSTGRMVQGDSAAVSNAFDSIQHSLTRVLGAALVCDRAVSGWTIRDRRWTTAEFHRALILAIPTMRLGTRPYYHEAARLGNSACTDRYSVPFTR